MKQIQEAPAEEPLEPQGGEAALVGGEHEALTAEEAAAAADLSSLAAAAVQEEPMAVVDEAAATAAALAAASTPGLPLQSIRVLNPDGTLSEPPPGLLAGLTGGVTAAQQQQEEEEAAAAAVLQQQQQQEQQEQQQLPQQYRVINAMTGEEVGTRNMLWNLDTEKIRLHARAFPEMIIQKHRADQLSRNHGADIRYISP